ncbi:hypothetical protein [Acrocarpospora pleiomorpha]|uniref:hypothetical protein n=1 Tax=Acrocarpospora pleiomorpha TaxID=90975 RepID=UPI0012D35AAA|nr:hypothetical protein [Acrocarpospora pleiomorpha]
MSKGRAAEFYWRVKNNDPSTSGLVVAVLATAGLESDATLIDKDTFADVFSGATNEPTNSGYERKILTDVDLAAFAVDDVNDRVDIDLPDQTWLDVLAGDDWSKAILGYDPDTTGGADSAIIPMVAWDFVVEPDGTEIQLRFNGAGGFRAQG